MTLGKDGVMAFDTKKVYKVPSFKPSKILDTTGAGDMFASGFLFKINKGESIDEALRYGCKTASKIISQYGARPDQNSFKNIKFLEKIIKNPKKKYRYLATKVC